MLDLKNKKKLIALETNPEIPNKESFELQPLDPGFGITLGNALRRTLLSSLEGFCVSAIKIEGVVHEFSTLKGIKEDLVEIILNIKKIRLKKRIQEPIYIEFCKGTIEGKGKDKITAGDLAPFIESFEILNPDLLICNCDDEKTDSFTISFVISRGKGYVPAEESEIDEYAKLHSYDKGNLMSLDGFIKIDSIYSPIRKVNYSTEKCLVGRKTDFEKLLLEVETDGSISPKKAIEKASEILIENYKIFLGENLEKSIQEDFSIEISKNKELSRIEDLKKKRVEDVFPRRIYNVLKADSTDTIGELMSKYTEHDIVNLRNIGEKSINDIKRFLKENGIKLEKKEDINFKKKG